MKNLRTTLLLTGALVLGMSFFGCSEQSLVIPSAQKMTQAEQPIVGGWKWIQTADFAGVRTPETTGHSEQYVFMANGTLLRYRDNVVTSTTHYQASEASNTLLIADEPDARYTVQISNGTMTLTSSQEDAGRVTFAKTN